MILHFKAAQNFVLEQYGRGFNMIFHFKVAQHFHFKVAQNFEEILRQTIVSLSSKNRTQFLLNIIP